MIVVSWKNVIEILDITPFSKIMLFFGVRNIFLVFYIIDGICFSLFTFRLFHYEFSIGILVDFAFYLVATLPGLNLWDSV